MAGLFERLFGWGRGNSDEEVGSGQIAKDRLHLVLVQDRVKLPASELQKMQEEMIAVISKYVSVDMDNVDFNISNRDRNGLLVAEIPFISVMNDDEEAEAAPDESDDSPSADIEASVDAEENANDDEADTDDSASDGDIETETSDEAEELEDEDLQTDEK